MSEQNENTKINNVKYSSKDVSIKWYEDGQLNVAYNCIDRHAKKNPDKIAIIWEGDNPDDVKKITYKELLINVSKAANVLKKIGVNINTVPVLDVRRKKSNKVIGDRSFGFNPKRVSKIGNYFINQFLY